MSPARSFTLTIVAAAALAGVARADKASVQKVIVYAQTYDANPRSWLVMATAHHNDRTVKHYCNELRVTTPDGKALKTFKIKRPMCPYGRRPFTQAIAGVKAKGGTIVVEARCNKDGWGGGKVTVDLEQAEGEGFKIIKGEALRVEVDRLIEACRAKDSKDMKGLLAAKASREQLANIGRVTTPQLLVALKDKNWVVRWSAMDVLGKVGDRKVVLEPLLGMYKDPNGTLRAVAVRTCAKYLSDPRVQEATFKMMGGGSRKYATEKLLKNRSTRPKAIAKLRELLADKSPKSRAFALAQLMPIDKGASKDAALTALKNEQNVKVRSAALEYLKTCKDKRPGTIEAIRALMESKEPQTRGEAFLAIIAIDPKQGYEIGIESLATESDGKAYRFILGKMFKSPARDNRLVDIIIAGLRSDDKMTRNLCGKAVPYFTQKRIKYYWDATPDFRAKQAAQWEKWWAENRATHKLPPLK